MTDLTDHSDYSATGREMKQLDYLERIAIALEKIADQPTATYNQFFQKNQGDPDTGNMPADPPVEAVYVQTKLCGDSPADIPERAGPCIRAKHHGVLGTRSNGGHRDVAGGEW